MNDYSLFAIGAEHVIQSGAQTHTDNWRLLRRLALPGRLNNPRGGAVKHALVLDVETTGLSLERDEVVQLAMLPFTYEFDTGRILEISRDRAFHGLREPDIPISDQASLVTGLTAEAVAGETIDGSVVEALVAEADLIIAHNASFDRVMVEKLWPCFASKTWACTLTDIAWLEEGFAAGKLDYLGMKFGWFFDGHDALNDCEACLALLAHTLPRSGELAMNALRHNAQKPAFLVRALGAPFDKKDELKRRGYRWRADDARFGKFWWTITDELDAETEWLQKEIYGDQGPINTSQVPRKVRFSDRVWELQ